MTHDSNRGRGQARSQFVILNAARTGSNYLCTLLNAHPDVLCHHEIFNPHVVGVARHLAKQRISLGTLEERERDPAEFLARVWRERFGRSSIGFKLCWRQTDFAFRAVLSDGAVSKIVLKRRNRLRTFVSLLLARQTGEWVVYRDEPAPSDRPQVHIDVAAFTENVEFNRAYYFEIESTLRETEQCSLTLYYEDLPQSGSLQETFDFLRVNPRIVEGDTWKLSPVDLRRTIANFDELRERLAGTEFEAELWS
jgi:LPS sulfotransferase NodH